MGDEQELHAIGHVFHQLAESHCVDVVQRRVDLVEQAEWRRVQLEYGEYQRDSRQCLLTAGEQMNAGIAFTGRASHHRDTGAQQIVVGELQIGMPAAEQTRKHDAQTLVDLLEGILETRTGLAIDFLNRGRQCIQRLLQILVLGIQIELPLRLLIVFLDGRQVDGSKTVDAPFHGGELVFPLRGLGLLAQAFQDRRQPVADAGKLLFDGLAPHRHLLGLETQCLQARALGADGLFLLDPGLLELAHASFGALDPLAGDAQ